jgi:uncharacterized membrane protein
MSWRTFLSLLILLVSTYCGPVHMGPNNQEKSSVAPPADNSLETPTCDTDYGLVSYEMVFEQVFRQDCVFCHSNNQSSAGINVENSEQASLQSKQILESVIAGRMPPSWFSQLEQEQVELVADWVQGLQKCQPKTENGLDRASL